MVALMAFDPDLPLDGDGSGGNLTYAIVSPPQFGNLSLVSEDELAKPAASFQPSARNFTVKQGEPLFLLYAPPPGMHGADSFAWTAYDDVMRSADGTNGTIVARVHISVKCPPGSRVEEIGSGGPCAR